MKSFAGKLAVVTGGGSGIGRGLVMQLAAQGCSVATCDLNEGAVSETAAMARVSSPQGTQVTWHACDVSDEAQVLRFRDEMLGQHAADHVDLVFNNAAIGGGSSFIANSREAWERTFSVDWWGVYYCTRAFLPLLIESVDGLLVNVSSVSGFWARSITGQPETAYSAAKFAVKGFSEALIDDLRRNAPHVKVAVVMPGYIGTDLIRNSYHIHETSMPGNVLSTGLDGTAEAVSPDAGVLKVEERSAVYRDKAPVSGAEAATIILDRLLAGQWRILVGEDARQADNWVRADPEGCYRPLPEALRKRRIISPVALGAGLRIVWRAAMRRADVRL